MSAATTALHSSTQCGQERRRLRVWLVTSSFPEVSEAFAGVEVRSLLRTGVDVSVFSLRRRRRFSSALLSQWGMSQLHTSYFSAASFASTIRLILGQPSRALWSLSWLVRSAWRRPSLLLRCLVLLPRIFQIFVQAQAARPDVVHLFWGHYPAVLGMMLHKWLPETVVSLSLGAYDLLYEFPPTIELASLADCVWTHADHNRKRLLELGVDPQKLRVAVRGVDLRLLPADCRSKNRRKIVTAGRMIKGKGMEYVLRSIAQIKPIFDDVQLVLLGDGDDRPRLERLAKSLQLTDNVTFRGNVSHESVFEELADASVFMLLSEWYAERLPNVVKEAMACRCICIVSDTPGIMEIMQPFQHKFVVRASDWMSAADCISSVFREPELFELDRDAGERFARLYLDSDEVARTRIAAWDRGSSRSRLREE